MTLSGGYVKLFRSILDDPIFTQLTPSVLKIALYFLVRANYKPMKWYDGRTKVDIPKGSFIASYATIAKETKLSIKQVRGAMEHLSNLEFAAYTRATHWTLITITNYERYQSNETEEGTTEGTIGAGSGHNEGTMRAGQGQQEKEDKEVKKVRSEEPSSSISIEEKKETTSPKKARTKKEPMTVAEVIAELQAEPAFVGLNVQDKYNECVAYCHAHNQGAPNKARLTNWLLIALQRAPLFSNGHGPPKKLDARQQILDRLQELEKGNGT